ncbi:MAG: hypothetical protein AAFP98_07745 [Pseudomonadota bacterium]
MGFHAISPTTGYAHFGRNLGHTTAPADVIMCETDSDRRDRRISSNSAAEPWSIWASSGNDSAVNNWGVVLMGWDDAFFAHSKIEPLIWDEDPGDHPLLAHVPRLLVFRAKEIVRKSGFRTRRTPAPKPVRIGVVRQGQRRTSVPTHLTA